MTPGQHVTPNVRLVRELGAGGMGSVWLADHLSLKNQVVVKFMLGELAGSTTARARFSREAEAAAQVKSPHVVQVFDHGLTDEGVPFIVMEHLEGRSLGDLLHEEGPLSPREVAEIVSQMCRGLARVHAAGILHRDIKPDNVFLVDGDGDERFFVKLLDFGIAKDVEAAAAHTTDTKTGQIVGTPHYMSPEQVTAQKDPDQKSDLWSVAIVAFEALTGSRPFEGNSFGGIAVAIATGPIPAPSSVAKDLPPGIDAWFARACSRDRDARFASAKELAESLREAVGMTVPLSSSGARSGRRADRDASAIALAATLVDTPSHDAPATGEASVEVLAPARAARSSRALVLGGGAFVLGVGVVALVAVSKLGPGAAPAPPRAMASETRAPATATIPAASASQPAGAEPPAPASPSATVVISVLLPDGGAHAVKDRRKNGSLPAPSASVSGKIPAASATTTAAAPPTATTNEQLDLR